MLSSVISSASSYFYLPVDDQDEAPVDGESSKCLTFTNSSDSFSEITLESSKEDTYHSDPVIAEILRSNDLYTILGVDKSPKLDKVSLRRAYLRRSRMCHPDKFADNPEATTAFQRVSVAYEILSNPSSRRVYDKRPASTPYDVFATNAPGQAEETFRSVVLGVFNDFLDGDLEIIRSLLKAINDINPALKLGEDGIDSVLVTLQAIRERALTCRACIYALHAELSRLIEVQHAFRQLSYFDLMGRSRLTIKLTRITLSLPIALEQAIRDQSTRNEGADERPQILPRRMNTLLRGVDGALERMERVLS